jgi:biopolymer transport protein ExbD
VRYRRKIADRPPALMLTSLLDMFTIILIFLIVSFDAESYEFRLNEQITLPESTSRSILKPAVNVEITKDAVLLEKEPLVRLVNSRAPAAYYETQVIPEVESALRVEFERRFGAQPVSQEPVMAGDNELDSREPIIVVQADKQLDYETLYLVLRSSAMAGFFKYRLATLKQ